MPGLLNPAALAAVGALYLLLCLAGLAVWALLLTAGRRRLLSRFDHAVAALRARPVRLRDAAALTALLLVFYAALNLLAVRYGGGDPTSQPVWLVAQGLAFHGTVIAAGFLLVFHRGGFGWAGLTTRWRRDIGWGLLGYLALMPPAMLYGLVYQLILKWAGYPIAPQETLMLFTADHPLWLRIYLYGLALIGAPLAEEIYFRGLLFPVALRWMRPASALVMVAALFALIHFHVPSMVTLFTVALCFAGAYLLTGSLLVPMVMHACFNGVNLLVLSLLNI